MDKGIARGVAPAPGEGSPVATTGDALQARQAKVVTPTQQALRRFRRHRLAVAGVIIVAIFIALSAAAPLVARRGPNDIDLLARNQGPTARHWLGTDRTGRDTFARTLYAGRISLSIGLIAAAISIV